MTGILSTLRGLPKTAAEYGKTIPAIEREVETSQEQLEKLVASRGPAIFDLSEADQKKLDDQIREAGIRTRNLELALSEAKKRFQEATANEAEEKAEAKLRADAKQWATDAKQEFELREKWLKLISEAYKIQLGYLQLHDIAQVYRNVGGSRAQKLGLIPADPLVEFLVKHNLSVGDQPINDPDLLKRLRIAANHFDSLADAGWKG